MGRWVKGQIKIKISYLIKAQPWAQIWVNGQTIKKKHPNLIKFLNLVISEKLELKQMNKII
jgi:hypothetical protein